MTVKEKMIEVFGEEKVKELINSVKPQEYKIPGAEVYSRAYVSMLEWLLDEYKEPDPKWVGVSKISETADPLSQTVPLQSRWSPEAYAEWKKAKEAKTKDVVNIENEEYGTNTEVKTEESKWSGKGRKPGSKNKKRNYDDRWYKQIVEDFYLSGEKSKDIRTKDDPSSANYRGIHGMAGRFDNAICDLGLSDEVKTHKYYQNTANECVTLDNVTVKKDPNTTYKYL